MPLVVPSKNKLQQKPLHNSLIISSQLSTLSQSSENDLQKSSRSSTSLVKKTLYDFVNIDSVNAILNQAEIELKEMKNIENLGKTILNAVEEQYNDITKSSNKLTQDMEKVNKNPINIDPKEMNQIEIRAIGKIVLEIAGHHDRIQHILDNPTLISSIDISGIH
jgi:DNA repair ATPase RecN